DRVEIDHTIDAVMARLHLDEALDGAEIIAEMQVAGWLDAGEDPGVEVGHEGNLELGELPWAAGAALSRGSAAAASVMAGFRCGVCQRSRSRALSPGRRGRAGARRRHGRSAAASTCAS